MEAPEYQSGFCTQFVTEKRHSIDNKAAAAAGGGGGGGGGDHFMVEDLLDFSNDDDAVIADTPFEEAATTTTAGNSTDSSTVTIVDSCNSSSFSGCDPNFMSDIGCRNFPDANFSSDLCVPYDDLAELEWLSNFVEESFSSEDLQKLQMISGMKARTVDETSETTTQHEPSIRNNSNSSPIFRPEMSVPAKARSKRSRAAPCNWTSRLLVLSHQQSTPPPPPQHQPSLPPSDPDIAFAKKTVKVAAAYSKKRDGGGGGGVESGGDGRKCLHCATDKTPQWRTGPMGPKTLCNACGVRYKSGRLVPEYRPAASPTFMLTKHSNSHRKVLELRRQKEMMRTHHHHHQHHHHQHQHQQQQFLHHHHHQNMVFDVTNGGDDYLIHSPVGPDFRQLI
ncbi:GATA transcription factor 12-like [Castanea sativa]|uniref:GATA transcription factor 12-like n=1 Tax=Castanea sativa TaxID=21020 RepID=UPI003F64A963